MVKIVAEIGINHNGSLLLAMDIARAAKDAGCHAVKLQKRSVEHCYTQSALASPRKSFWGGTTRDQKNGIELSLEDYRRFSEYCAEIGIEWYASAWDVPSVRDLESLNVCRHKVPSALIVDLDLLRAIATTGKPVVLSTGMSSQDDIDAAMAILTGRCPIEIMHSVSAYPTAPEQANLATLLWLRERYGLPVGYSGHEMDQEITLAAVALGASSIERHVTMSRGLTGSDQSISLEPDELATLVRQIRNVEKAIGKKEKVFQGVERAAALKLREHLLV